MTYETGLLIDGRWLTDRPTLPVMNPWDDSVVAEVATASTDDIDAAVAAADRGAVKMRRLPAHERAAVLARAARLVAERHDDFTRTIIAESGKPLRYAAAEARRARQTLHLAAEEAKRLHGETVPLDAAPGSEHRRGFFVRVPLGIIAAIAPFNFPLNLACHKVAPALAAGNSVVLKPASATPLSSLMLAETLLEAGLPPTALSVLIGSGTTVGMELVHDARVRMVTFTGSAEVGETIKANSGLKRIALELGSNSGAIIDETADLDDALGKCIVGGFAYSGQICIHTQRLYIHESVAEEFTDRFVKKAKTLTCGDPALPATAVGPMIDRAAIEKALDLIKDAQEAGAELLCGGEYERNVLHPTVLTGLSPEMPVVCEETFAPIVTIETFADFGDGIAKFNAGSVAGNYAYGLAAGVFTRDVNRALRAAERIETGNVYINDSPTFRADLQPYGGVRDSGIGREGPRFAIEEMTDIRMVSFNLGSH